MRRLLRRRLREPRPTSRPASWSEWVKPRRAHSSATFADAAAPIVGGLIVLVSALRSSPWLCFWELTSGFFLFTATGDLLPEAHHRFPTFAVTIAMLVGILFIFAAMTLVASL